MFHISLNSYTPFFLKKQEYQISASQIYSNLLTDTSYATLFCASSPSNFFTYSRLWIRPQICTWPPTSNPAANLAFLPQQMHGI